MIKSQLGLLQEGLIFGRLVGQIRNSITPGQSGYVRDVGDAHLLLQLIMAESIGLAKPCWVVFGDLQKAFPRTWRQAMLEQLWDKAGVRDGM